jgi:sugar phosphate permease
VGFCCALSVVGIFVFSYFDLKYGKPSTVDKGGSSVNHEGEKIDCKSWKYLNTKLVWYSIINTWFAQQVYLAFSSWLTNLLTKRFMFELKDSTIYQALMPISVMIGIPFWSAIAVKQGKKMTLMFYGYVVVVFSFFSIWLMPERPTMIVGVPLFFIGQFLAI